MLLALTYFPPSFMFAEKNRKLHDVETKCELNSLKTWFPVLISFHKMWLWCLNAKERGGWRGATMMDCFFDICIRTHSGSTTLHLGKVSAGMCWTWFESKIYEKGFYQRVSHLSFLNFHLMISIWLSKMTNALYVSAVDWWARHDRNRFQHVTIAYRKLLITMHK